MKNSKIKSESLVLWFTSLLANKLYHLNWNTQYSHSLENWGEEWYLKHSTSRHFSTWIMHRWWHPVEIFWQLHSCSNHSTMSNTSKSDYCFMYYKSILRNTTSNTWSAAHHYYIPVCPGAAVLYINTIILHHTSPISMKSQSVQY